MSTDATEDRMARVDAALEAAFPSSPLNVLARRINRLAEVLPNDHECEPIFAEFDDLGEYVRSLEAERVQVGWAWRAVYRPNAKGPWLFALTVPLPNEKRGQFFTVEVCPIYAPSGVKGFIRPTPMPPHDTSWCYAEDAP